MAKKGQKFNKYPSELKLEIVNKYLNNQGTSRSLAKEYGMSYHSIENMIYTYKRQGHLNGIRTSKVVNNIETKYYLEGNTIVFEDRNNTMLYYLYNGDELLGLVYNGSTYYYHKNVFGDIIGILNHNYEEIVTYEYDSWGEISSIVDNSGINLGTINPFRYRSYYYDEETKLYYLNSRYYNPEWGRFVNGDETVATGQEFIGHNMYNYCGNNPINRSDDLGKGWLALSLGVGAICGVINGALQVASNAASGKKGKKLFDDVGGAVVSGFVSGFLEVAPVSKIGKGVKMGVSLITGVVEAGMNQLDNGTGFNGEEFVVDVVGNVASTIISDKYGSKVVDYNPTGRISSSVNSKRGKTAILNTTGDLMVNMSAKTVSNNSNTSTKNNKSSQKVVKDSKGNNTEPKVCPLPPLKNSNQTPLVCAYTFAKVCKWR